MITEKGPMLSISDAGEDMSCRRQKISTPWFSVLALFWCLLTYVVYSSILSRSLGVRLLSRFGGDLACLGLSSPTRPLTPRHSRWLQIPSQFLTEDHFIRLSYPLHCPDHFTMFHLLLLESPGVPL